MARYCSAVARFRFGERRSPGLRCRWNSREPMQKLVQKTMASGEWICRRCLLARMGARLECFPRARSWKYLMCLSVKSGCARGRVIWESRFGVNLLALATVAATLSDRSPGANISAALNSPTVGVCHRALIRKLFGIRLRRIISSKENFPQWRYGLR